ncbi:MAG TPA: hypothetical protein VJ715_11910, partial [Pyrinomonadaceae bacterium]|nr:hypothetical protein [Pyrinomonadaceae bacterium]
MKMTATLKRITLALALSLTFVATALAQDEQPQPEEQKQEEQQATPQEEKEPKKRGGILGAVFGQDAKTNNGEQEEAETSRHSSVAPRGADRLEPDDVPALPEDVPAEVQAGRRGQLSEEAAAVLPYYNNFLTTYRIGPEDV